MSTPRCSPTVWSVVNTMYAAGDTVMFFFDNQTGDMVCLEDPFDSDEPDEALEQLLESHPERFALLPGFEVLDEPSRYVRFARTLEEGTQEVEELLHAARSLHARSLFDEAVERAGQRAAWEKFRETEYIALAWEWLKETGFIRDETP